MRANVVLCDGARAAALAAGSAAIRNVISFDGEGPGVTGFDALLEGSDSPFTAHVPVPTERSTIAYTSGATGRPKGAMQPHRAVLSNCALTATMHARTELDVIVTALPVTHVYGNVAIKVLRRVYFVDDLPKTSSGKIMRRELGKKSGRRACRRHPSISLRRPGCGRTLIERSIDGDDHAYMPLRPDIQRVLGLNLRTAVARPSGYEFGG